MSRNIWSKKLALMAATAAAMVCCQSAFAETVEMDLEDAMLRAFNTNPAISIAEYEKKAAKADYDAARQSHYISIKGEHITGRGGSNHDVFSNAAKSTYIDNGNGTSAVINNITNDPYNVGKQIGNSSSNSISVTMPIYTGGNLRGATKKAKAGYNVSVAEQQIAWNEMRSTVTNGYFQVLQAENMTKLSKEAVDRLTEHLKNVQAQYDVGVVAKVDVLRSQVELSNAEQDMIKAQNGYDVAVASLDRIVGLPMDTELKLVNLLTYAPYDYDLNYCLQYAADNRPEITKAKEGIRAAEGSLLVARSGYEPQIGASFKQNFGGEKVNPHWPGDKKGNWTAGISVSMNIFDSGVTYSKIHAAKERYSIALEQYRDAVDGVNLDVRSKYLNLREAEKRIHTTDVAVERAEEDYRIAQLRYQAGVGTNTDVMDASVALTQAKTNYLQALYDYNTSKTDLKTAIGEPMTFPVKVTVEPEKKAEEAAK